ncbi:kinesin-like protein KIF12 isoform X6 [Patagioenas fasciata]|uniref:kinesin-like protein KIF12 isoform X6 n=1 Tax=Patagioenas fasciata TaxID=372321 RepID=UPI003A98E4D5
MPWGAAEPPTGRQSSKGHVALPRLPKSAQLLSVGWGHTGGFLGAIEQVGTAAMAPPGTVDRTPAGGIYQHLRTCLRIRGGRATIIRGYSPRLRPQGTVRTGGRREHSATVGPAALVPGVPVGRSPSWGAPSAPLPSVAQRSPGEERDGPAVGRETRLRVVLRVRPLTRTEIQRGDRRVVHSLGDGTIHVSAPRHNATFGFNAVFDAGTSQEAVFEGSGMRQLVELAIDGFSCTIFAFGQTGSGKTYTLMGPFTQNETRPAAPGLLGLMQRSFACLLEQSQSCSSDLALSASYLEIYNEQVRDLLSPGPPCVLPLRWSKTCGFYVENQLSVDFESLETITELLLQGSQRRRTSAHALNRHSSRSHAVLTIHVRSRAVSTCPAPGTWGGLGGTRGLCGDAKSHRVKVTSSFPKMRWWGWGEQQGAKSQTQGLGRCCGPWERGEEGPEHHPPTWVPQPSTRPSKQGTLCFVDLAGSERVKETGSSGELSVEANNINRSLLALGHCISLLAKSQGKRTHIPYRDSKLTRLLARSLGGSGVTLMVACISPSSRCLSETLSTLHYASRARKVTTRPTANRVSRVKLLQTLEEEIHALQLENLSLRQQLCLPRVPMKSMEVPGTPLRPGAWPGWGGRYGSLGMCNCPLEGQLLAEGAPAWPSLYGLLRDFVVENEQLRQPRLSPDPSSDISAGPNHRAAHSSCDSQPLLQSARTPCVPHGHPTRLRQPDATPVSATRLPASVGGPGLHGHPHVGLCLWQGEDAQPTPPLPPASRPSCSQCCPGLADAIMSQTLPGPPIPQPVPPEGSTGVMPPGQEDVGLLGSHQLPRLSQLPQRKRRSRGKSRSSSQQHQLPRELLGSVRCPSPEGRVIPSAPPWPGFSEPRVGRGTGLAGRAHLSSRAMAGASSGDLAQPTHSSYTWENKRTPWGHRDLGLQGLHRPWDG